MRRLEASVRVSEHTTADPPLRSVVTVEPPVNAGVAVDVGLTALGGLGVAARLAL